MRVAVYPESREWLLRYNIDEGDEDDYTTAWCDFDFSCTPDRDHAPLIVTLR